MTGWHKNQRGYQNYNFPYVQKTCNRGIRNSGNTCYINSVLQCLHKSYHFTSTFIKFYKDSSAININLQELRLSNLIDKFISQMWKQYELPFEAEKIKKIVQVSNPVFKGYFQNDSIQFFITLISILNLQLQPKVERKYISENNLYYNQNFHKSYQNIGKSFCQETFTGTYKITYNCLKCNSNFTLQQAFNFHYIDICYQQGQKQTSLYRSPKKVCLKNCLKKFKNVEQLRGENKMTCDKCEKQTDTDKYMQILQANKIFVVCIKRFCNGYKNRAALDVHSDSELKPEDVMLNSSQYKNKVYKLFGAISHSGDLYGGHYSASCFNYKSGKWIKYSDSYTHILQKPDFSDAYVLFYSLVDKQTDKAKNGTLQHRQQRLYTEINQERNISNANQWSDIKIYNLLDCLILCLFQSSHFIQYFNKLKTNQNQNTKLSQPQFSQALCRLYDFKKIGEIQPAYFNQLLKLHKIIEIKDTSSGQDRKKKYPSTLIAKIIQRFNKLTKHKVKFQQYQTYECQKGHQYNSKISTAQILKLKASENSITAQLEQRRKRKYTNHIKIICKKCNYYYFYRKQIRQIENLLIIQLQQELQTIHKNFKIQSEIKQSELFGKSRSQTSINQVYSLIAMLKYNQDRLQAQVFLLDDSFKLNQTNLKRNIKIIRAKQKQLVLQQPPLLLFYQKRRKLT